MKLAENLRNTPQRKLILEIVNDSCDHPTAETIYKRASEKMRGLSLGTVYRNLHILSELGSIQRLTSPIGPDHFDFNLSAHYHFYCKNCGEMSDIPEFCAPNLESMLAPQKSGFDIESHTLCYVGTCPKCKNIKMEA